MGAAFTNANGVLVGKKGINDYSNDANLMHDQLHWQAPGYTPDTFMLDSITSWLKRSYPGSSQEAHW